MRRTCVELAIRNFVFSRLLLVAICEGGSHVSWRSRFCMKYDFRTFLCWYSRRKHNQIIKTLCEDVAVNSVVVVMLDIWGFRICQLWCSLTNDFLPEQFWIYLRIITRNQQSVWQMYFYQIRWFDITAFAFKAPKVQEVVEITASGPPPFVCKYYKLYIQQIS